MTTYKQRLNQKYGLDKDIEHTLRELKDLTGVPIKIMKEVEKRGKGAYANNLGSVRLNDFRKTMIYEKEHLNDYLWNNGARHEFTHFYLRAYSKICDIKNKIWTYLKN